MTLEALRAAIEGLPGVTGEPARNQVTLYKVMGKMFAIVAAKQLYVILKCDPHLAEVLREQYAGVGHKSHLVRRFWIAVELASDVPESETARLVAHSYDLVRAGLTKKQQADLAALG